MRSYAVRPAQERSLGWRDRPDRHRSRLTALTALGDDPYREDADVKKLTGPAGLHRLRVGSFRVAYQITEGELVILVVKVGDRRAVYRNRNR
ncbi:type II toxin-antitoxin system RelE family toxin [Streptomyces turgidiscabies]|uniref:mRNA interferase RelE/StbE n=1 Tax=Streptomyces turgidiscabies TaxID=85558 RepID=A0ABU0RT98_9ACTN|nr:type II toxin-antitoxin system RelE/ParE family toxin [Streptomyces turgidiscabies]MDQ0934948.1 mRNA interferase RelE/StbE [Streptomyces turgidiscabies]